jgi:hypothetical protein
MTNLRVGIYAPNESYRMAQEYIDKHGDCHVSRLLSGLLNQIDFKDLTLKEHAGTREPRAHHEDAIAALEWLLRTGTVLDKEDGSWWTSEIPPAGKPVNVPAELRAALDGAARNALSRPEVTKEKS